MAQGIFISYRRDTGSTMARMIYDRLRLEKRYQCFLDVEKLNAGNFKENIATEMSKCRIFLLILSRNALDRCSNPNDNVRQEILAAIERNLHIIPVTAEDFIWPETMPEGLSRVKEFNAIPYVQVYSEQFFERLYSFIENVFAEDRSKKAAIRNAEIAAKTAELSAKTKQTLKTVGQTSVSALSDMGKSASDVAKESIQKKSLDFSVIGILAAIIIVFALGLHFLGLVKTIVLVIILLVLAIIVWVKKKSISPSGSGQNTYTTEDSAAGTERAPTSSQSEKGSE